MNQPPPDDPVRDAHLLAALRHAPDCGVAQRGQQVRVAAVVVVHASCPCGR